METGTLLGSHHEALIVAESLGLDPKSVDVGDWKTVTTSFYESLYTEERLWGSVVRDRSAKHHYCGALAFFASDDLKQELVAHPWLLLHLSRLRSLHSEVCSFQEVERAWMEGSRNLNMVIGLSYFPRGFSRMASNQAMSAFRQDFLQAATIFPLKSYHAQTFGDYTVYPHRGAHSFRQESGAKLMTSSSSGAVATEHWGFSLEDLESGSASTLSHLYEAFNNFRPQTRNLACDERVALYLSAFRVPQSKIGALLGIETSSVKKKIGRAKKDKLQASELTFPFVMVKKKHEIGLIPQWVISRDLASVPDHSVVLAKAP